MREFISGGEAIARAAIQAKDEIAAIGFCIGAAMTGARVMTATSGPGMSLFSENIGLAIMALAELLRHSQLYPIEALKETIANRKEFAQENLAAVEASERLACEPEP